MCGIVGYTGGRKVKDLLLEGLRRLEYRGYDSSGVALYENNEIKTYRRKGKIEELSNVLDKIESQSSMGIAHTRWATHGEPSEKNAHPHSDCKGNLFVVHNGIIENYRDLKKFLEQKGHIFLSDTDTEVLPHLFEEFYHGDLKEAILKGLKLIEGAYGICVIHKNHPGLIIGARKGSPLIIGLGDKENFLVSDVSAIVSYTRNVIFLDDGEIAEITPDSFKTYQIESEKIIDKHIEQIDWEIDRIEKGGFQHFMLKEIFEQPFTIQDSFRGRLQKEECRIKLGGIKLTPREIREIQRVIFIACGTSWHSGIYGKYLMEELARIPSEHEHASEFRYRQPVVGKNDLYFAITQSGETADTLAAVKLVKEQGAKVFGITNVVGSSIARETDAGMYTHAGPEIGVASTKAFTAQLIAVAMISIMLASANNAISNQQSCSLIAAIEECPNLVEKVLQNSEAIKKIALKYKDVENTLYLGRGLNYPIALEGALKLKEISYIHAEGYPAAEMKHGPIALIDEKTPCVMIATKDFMYDKIISNIREIKARKGKVIAVASEGDKEIAEIADDVIFVPHTDPHIQPIINVVPLQLIAYYIAVERSLDVDKPRNLAKSVTVE